jgi:hypothetical protein
LQSNVDVMQVHAIDRSVANQLHPGQDAVLRFSAFNQRTTLKVLAKLETVAADLFAIRRPARPEIRSASESRPKR